MQEIKITRGNEMIQKINLIMKQELDKNPNLTAGELAHIINGI